VIKFSHLSPYNSGSPMKSWGTLLGSSPIVTPILGCNMAILVALRIICIYVLSLTNGCIWNGAIVSCILLDVVLQYGGFAMHIKRLTQPWYVASTNIATSGMIVWVTVATKHMAAIWQYCREWTCRKIALLPLHSYVGIWPYCYLMCSIASKKSCNVTNLVVRVTIAMFISWWQ
jgi:hypothetical protein